MKAVFFDMDGVLIDSFQAWFSTLNALLKHFGKKQWSSEEFIQRAWAKPFEDVAAEFFKGIDLNKIAEFYYGHLTGYAKKVKVFPVAPRLLSELQKRNITIAVVSNSYHQITELMLKAAKLYDYCDLIIGGNEVKQGKPAPDMILLALKKLHLKKNEVIFIGDTIYDITAGKSAGVRTIGIGVQGDDRAENLGEVFEKLCLQKE